MKKIDWEEGTATMMLVLAIITVMVFAMVTTVEVGGWFGNLAWLQTRSDAILEGAAIAADTGYIDAGGGSLAGSNSTGTALDPKRAEKMAEIIANKNLEIMNRYGDFREEANFQYYLNTNKSLNGYNKLDSSDGQRVLTIVSGMKYKNYFNFTEEDRRIWAVGGAIKIIGHELPLGDSSRFSQFYPNDPRIPISALTSNSGGKMTGVFNLEKSEFKNIYQKAKEMNDSTSDARSGAVYAAILDQFCLDYSEKYDDTDSTDELSTGVYFNKYMSDRYSEDTYKNGYKIYSEDYIYQDMSKSNAPTTKLNASLTLLWDISTAMNCEVPRYVKVEGNSRKNATYYEWTKGRKDVQLNGDTISEVVKYNGIESIGSGNKSTIEKAILSANSGNLTFAVDGDVIYFIRPVVTDGSEWRYGDNGGEVQTKFSCAYVEHGDVEGSNNNLVDLKGLQLYYIQKSEIKVN